MSATDQKPIDMADADYIEWLTTYKPPDVIADWFAWLRGEDTG